MAKSRGGSLPVDVRIDAVLQLQLIGRLLTERTMQKLRESGFEDLRESDGYVFQHLVVGPIAVTDLASRLGVTQQAASKNVADLEARGYVVRRSAGHDARVRLVALSDRGTRVVKTTRAVRAALEKKLLGQVHDPTRFARTLSDIAESLGGRDALARRSLAPPS